MTTKKSTQKDVSSWSLTARVLVLSLLIGGVSGVSAGAVTTKWLADYSSELARFSTPISSDEPLPINLPQSYAEAVNQIRTDVPPAVVTVFKIVGNEFTHDLVAPENQISAGLVVTSDGWLLAEVPDFNVDQASQLKVLVADKLYGVSTAVSSSLKGWWFLKAENASNLPVRPFGAGLSLLSGDQVVLVPSVNAMEPSYITARMSPSIKTSSDYIETRFLLQPIATQISGAVVVNTRGDVVGFFDRSTENGEQLIPIEVFLPAIRSILKTGSVQNIGLGLTGDNISLLPSGITDIPNGATRGFLITGIPKTSEALGFKIGDVILSVNGEWVDDRSSLASYINTYAIQDTLIITVLRDEREQTISATLLELL